MSTIVAVSSGYGPPEALPSTDAQDGQSGPANTPPRRTVPCRRAGSSAPASAGLTALTPAARTVPKAILPDSPGPLRQEGLRICCVDGELKALLTWPRGSPFICLFHTRLSANHPPFAPSRTSPRPVRRRFSPIARTVALATLDRPLAPPLGPALGTPTATGRPRNRATPSPRPG